MSRIWFYRVPPCIACVSCRFPNFSRLHCELLLNGGGTWPAESRGLDLLSGSISYLETALLLGEGDVVCNAAALHLLQVCSRKLFAEYAGRVAEVELLDDRCYPAMDANGASEWYKPEL